MCTRVYARVSVYACVLAVCVCVCVRACQCVCCFVGTYVCIPLTMLADVCQCCRLLCLYAYRFSRHFPHCKTWWIKNLNLNCTTEGERQAGIWKTAATWATLLSTSHSKQARPQGVLAQLSVWHAENITVSWGLFSLGRLRSLCLISHCPLYDRVCITAVAYCHCMIVFVGYCLY